MREPLTIPHPDQGSWQAAVDPSVPIRRYVDVQTRPTVVRLDVTDQAADWVTSSFYITRDIRSHLGRLAHVLAQPTGSGMFLIGPYGSGKSHWLAYVTCQLRAGKLVEKPPDVAPLSLLNFRSSLSLEDIVCRALGIKSGGDDRRAAWGALVAGRPQGLLLVLDELSEFLRSKPDERTFHEDVRFLQFLGEWASTARFWVIAAMQEGIEHTGELEHGLYRKIKDRFPLRFLLSPAHVTDLIQESILIRKAGFDEAVDALAVAMREALPDGAITSEQLYSLYPLHPATLDLLEEVRDRFSQARGAIDFTVTQLLGDPSRGVAPFLDRPWGTLLTPDIIVDHFRDLFELQPEFLGLAQQFFPHYRQQLPELFPTPAVRELAERLLKLLVLAYLSPARSGVTVAEAASWLLFRPARVDPRKNLEIPGRILRQLVEQGRFVVEREQQFCIELRDDGVTAFEAFLKRETAALRNAPSLVHALLADELGDDDFNPLSLPQETWHERSVKWHFHDRAYHVYVGNEPPPPMEGVALCVRLPWGAAAPAHGCATLRPAQLAGSDQLLELAALLRARSRTWGRDAQQRLAGRLHDRLSQFRSEWRAAFRDVLVTGPTGEPETPPRIDPASSTRSWLDQYAEWLLRRRYPAFERFAPGHGPLPKEAYRSLMRVSIQGDPGNYDADEYVKLIREAYLVPMRLLVRQGRNYAVPPNLDRHELVTLIRPLLDLQPEPALVYDNAALSVYGLVPDQTGLLLVLLLILGELDIRKGRRSYRELFETLPDPLQYDQVVRCAALRGEQLRSLRQLCEGLHVRTPQEWTVLAQRRAVPQLQEAIGRQTGPLRSLLAGIQQEDQADELVHAIRQLLAWEQTLRQGNDELTDLQQFLFEIGSASRFLSVIQELQGLPERLDRVLIERKRFQHLFRHPALTGYLAPSLAIRIEELQQPPSLAQLDHVERWLQECRTVYEKCKEDYRGRHEAWREQVAADPVWTWQPPCLAASRHVGVHDLLDRLQACRQRAERMRCTGLANLDFQPVCVCGFDGQQSPLADELHRLKSLGGEIEQAVTNFFQQESVRTRMREWVEQGLETTPGTLAYLRGDAPFPQVADLELLDRHLAGVELVKEADAAPVVDLLCARTWEKESLVQALRELVQRLPGAQLRFRRLSPFNPSEVAEWIIEQSLRSGVPLPAEVRGRVSDELLDRLRPEWVSPAAVSRLSHLGLGEQATRRIVGWMTEGQVPLPPLLEDGRLPADESPLVSAARELVRPTSPSDARGLGELAERLYRSHEAMMRLAGPAWLDRLEHLARTPLPPAPALTHVLDRHSGRQYLMIDGLGVPLLRSFGEALDVVLPEWRLQDVEFAQVGAPSTTDGCYRSLVAAGWRATLHKVNCVDDLLHASPLPFDDLIRLALAQLAVACRPTRSRLDRYAPLVVFADHGFRIAPDGASYVHGGDSTLERFVPVLFLAPR